MSVGGTVNWILSPILMPSSSAVAADKETSIIAPSTGREPETYLTSGGSPVID